MTLERAHGLVIRGYDFSETSRVVTLWTREFGKLGALAKGARRLKSAFETSLDLLNVCDIVLVRKTSGALDLLTEAKVRERFPRLRTDLQAWYVGQYIAEILGDWTEPNDPHPDLFDEALGTLRDLAEAGEQAGPRLARFELVLLRELGYGPAMERCAACDCDLNRGGAAFSPSLGGLICPACEMRLSGTMAVTASLIDWLHRLREAPTSWRELADADVRKAMRRLLGDYVTFVRGRRPRLLPYLRS